MLANLYDQLIDFEAAAGKAGLVADGDEDRADDRAQHGRLRRTCARTRFALDPKATFSDGKPITAEDVKYTFQRGIEGEQYTKTVMGMLTLRSAKNITIVDPQTIRSSSTSPTRWPSAC